MTEPLLTLIISTFNRSDILKKNLEKLLSYDIDYIRIIVGNNASTDDTERMLTNFDDERLTVYKNKINYGIHNVFHLIQYVDSSFFLFLNDRDIILEDDIIFIDKLLKTHGDCDILALTKTSRMIKEGNYFASDFFSLYYLANHPGDMIYNTCFYRKHIHQAKIESFLSQNNYEEINRYINYQLMMNIRNGYFYPRTVIQQPVNRDATLSQVRNEVYGSSYVLPEYHERQFKSLAEYSNGYPDKEKVKKLLLARYKTSLDKVEIEFYNCVGNESFRKRNHCENAKRSEWLKNGTVLTKGIIRINEVLQLRMRTKIIRFFLSGTAVNLLRIIRALLLKLKKR